MDIDTLRAKYTALASVFTERSRRLWAATEARAVNKDERLLTDVEALVEPTASGDPARLCAGQPRACGIWRES